MMARCCDCGAAFPRDADQDWKRRCLACWAIAKARREGRPATGAPQPDPVRDELGARMRALLSLCHPDRHGNSTLATNTTAWLLSVRDRLEVKEATR